MTVTHPDATVDQADTPRTDSPQRRRDLPRSTPAERQAHQQRARTLYLGGESIRDIARQLGRSYGYARNLLLDAGVELRPSGRQPRPHQQQLQ
jgi:transposase-like protein